MNTITPDEALDEASRPGFEAESPETHEKRRGIQLRKGMRINNPLGLQRVRRWWFSFLAAHRCNSCRRIRPMHPVYIEDWGIGDARYSYCRACMNTRCVANFIGETIETKTVGGVLCTKVYG